MHESNLELVAAVTGGEIHRYAEIVQRFDAKVRSIVGRNVSDPGSLEDLVQETFYRAFKQLGSLNDPTRFEPWLVMIAKNCVNDFYRDRTRRRVLEQKSKDEFAVPQTRDETPVWIWEEVAGLPPEFSEVLRLKYQLTLSYRDIARRLNIPESTARGRLHEARKFLKRRLKDKGLFP